MDDKVKNAFARYEELKTQEKAIKTELDELKEIILHHVPEETKVNGKLGFFQRKTKSNWTFTPETELRISQVEDLKKEEIARGEATNNPTVFIEWRANKNEPAAE